MHNSDRGKYVKFFWYYPDTVLLGLWLLFLPAEVSLSCSSFHLSCVSTAHPWCDLCCDPGVLKVSGAIWRVSVIYCSLTNYSQTEQLKQNLALSHSSWVTCLGATWLVVSAQVLSRGLGWEPQLQASGGLVGASRRAFQLAAVKRLQLLPSCGHEAEVPPDTLTTCKQETHESNGEPQCLTLSQPVSQAPTSASALLRSWEASHQVPPAFKGMESKVYLLRGALSGTLWTFKDHHTWCACWKVGFSRPPSHLVAGRPSTVVIPVQKAWSPRLATHRVTGLP